jgi:DNA-binding transcriptional ArsR family regulator
VARLDAADISEMHARVCKALADPKRLLIINELRDGPKTVGDIASALEISQPNVRRHLAVPLISLGAILSMAAYREWRRNQRALRLGATRSAPPPATSCGT